MMDGGCSQDQVKSVLESLTKLLSCYNDRADVSMSAAKAAKKKSKVAADDDEDLGILVGAKKANTIENWLLKSTPEFWQSVDAHLHEHVLACSGWSEKLWNNQAALGPGQRRERMNT